MLVHLFNLAGYSLLFEYLGDESSRHFALAIEKEQYNEADLVEVRVKLNLPYFTSSSEYETLSGEININGNNHSYVKRKVSQDTLYLLCLPNTEKDQIRKASDNYGSVANDFDGSHKKENQLKKAESFNQYHQQNPGYVVAAPSAALIEPTTFISTIFPDSFVEMYGKPPRQNS